MYSSLSAFALFAISAIAGVTAQCPEASRFGNLNVNPTNLVPLQKFHISANLTCAVNSFDIVPNFLDYYLVVPSSVNNGHEPNYLLAHRTFTRAVGTQQQDSFSTTVPDGFFFAGAAYNILLQVTYPITGKSGNDTVIIQGGVFEPINLTVSSS